jgi:hypothetical protein
MPFVRSYMHAINAQSVIVQWAHNPGFACAGSLEAPQNIGWSSLPYHLEELILFRLSLLELARISATCGSLSRGTLQSRSAEVRPRAGCEGGRPFELLFQGGICGPRYI